MSKVSSEQIVLTKRELQLIRFIRQLGWGEIRLRVENGQPVLIYEAIRTVKLEEEETAQGKGKTKTGTPMLNR
ncbi:hypothetical protein [Desulfovirgula thermocuniculi]|uniref:hypothetical protein n=1 Tax=Desulfovirgula thermocuniculi TaxID=348842 RepID=UPI000412E748|nr:hypothetical protein [Desulfovirgula thermocuniculi]